MSEVKAGLSQRDYVAEVVAADDLPEPTLWAGVRERQAKDTPETARPLSGLTVSLGDAGTGYVYRFSSPELAHAAAPGFLGESNFNEVAGCGSHVYYSDAEREEREIADRWSLRVGSILERTDPTCRDDSAFGVVS